MQNMEKINHRESTVRQKWVEYLNHFLKNRMYLCILLLTAICAYGYKVTNVTIGIDDTPSLYYFEEGLIAIVGRWVLFLLNKICSIAEFLPFLTDFAAVVLLVIAAIVWSALFYSVFGEKIPDILDDEEAMSTINKFFENNLNISETARQLYVHRNTLVYRLERIEKAIGLDIRTFDDAMTFRIAVMVIAHMRDQM